MTSQTLIDDRVDQFPTSALSDLASTITSDKEIPSENSRKLPYQATHQVELLHLQAETEALLQEIQTVKQQRVDLAQ